MQAASVVHCDIFYGNLSERLGYLAEQGRHRTLELAYKGHVGDPRGKCFPGEKVKGRQVLAKRKGQQQKQFLGQAGSPT